MFVASMLLKHLRASRSRASVTLLALGAALALAAPAPALAQTKTACGPEVKEEVLRTMASMDGASEDQKLAVEQELYEKFQYCAKDAAQIASTSTFHVAAKQCGAKASLLGSTYYEEMTCCGYDPQRRQFACPVKIKQTFGFGGAPLPGSREHVLHCVADAAGMLIPVGHDSVHLANALPGQVPTWQFAVIAAANDNLYLVNPMNGQTRRARSILSWQLQPTNCNYQPIWGNALDYRIRLDQ